MRVLAIILLLGAACAPRRVPTTVSPDAQPTPHARASTAVPVEPPAAVEPPAVEEPTTIAPAPAPEPSEPAPLPEAERTIFFGTLSDEAPEDRESVAGIDNEKHYVAGNEQRLDAFASTIANKGGGYVGVGSDQAYLFIGWARPELAWLVDYDPMVVDVHLVYRAFLRNAETPDDFLALWEQSAKEQALAAIRNEPGASKRHVRAYGRNRGWILRRLKMVGATMRAQETASFLTDQQQYAFVRELVLADRVRALVADLKGDGAIQAIGTAARELGVPVRVLYLSNAEGYWSRYRGKFRRNIAALPFDEQSVVLRTLLIWHINADYRYNVQPALNYVQWLARPFISTVYDIVHDRPEPSKAELNFFVTEGDPDASPAARRAAEEQSKR
ncbi:MAG TPA: hypothetical protein VG755_17105 [Nannocystaceae bacterium]|nr:hypothetical protein [Nannocystaceae bacterium]